MYRILIFFFFFILCFFFFFFFSSRRRHTRYIGDWSSRRVLFRSATNSGVSSTPCPNESDKVSEDLYAQKEIAGGDDAARDRFRCRLRRSFGTEHETFASAFDCAFAARRRGGGNNCLQRDQKPAGWSSGHQPEPHRQGTDQRSGRE